MTVRENYILFYETKGFIKASKEGEIYDEFIIIRMVHFSTYSNEQRRKKGLGMI